MNKKIKVFSLVLLICSVLILLVLVLSNTKNFSSLLKASVSGSSEETNEIIIAARSMALDNIDSLKESNVITIKDLIKNKYLTGDEINPSTNEKYDENTRIYIIVKNGQLEDIYLSGELFRNTLSCEDVCYIQDRNYIEFNNDTYRILKIDKEGNIYIYNNDIKKVDKNDIDKTIKNKFNSFNNSNIVNVINISKDDLLKGNVDIEENIVVSTSEGYKIYNVDTNEVEEISNGKVNIFPIIVLDKDITYVLGDGSKFNPFILGE